MGRYVPELDRWYVWMIVKSLDLPYRQAKGLLNHLGLTVFDDGQEYVAKSDFKSMLSRLGR